MSNAASLAEECPQLANVSLSQQSANSNHNSKIALELARAGIAVFPARVIQKGNGWDKVPLVPWRNEATTDEAQIDAWWTANPDAVPGIELSRLDLVVIDADRHGGPDGIAVLESLIQENEALPTGPKSITAGGGWHLFFRQPEGIRLGNRRGSLPPGIDVRGDGGWIVAPGSIRPDGAVWRPVGMPLVEALRTGSVPLMPGWLRSLIDDDGVRLDLKQSREIEHISAATQECSSKARSSERERAYAADALEKNANELRNAKPGQRNATLNAIAYRMGRMIAADWIEKPVVADALREACLANGLMDDDGEDAVQRTMASGIDAGLSNPHEDLRDDGDEWRSKLLAQQSFISVRWDGEGKFDPPTWLIRDLATDTAVGLILGESQAGKSFIAVYLAVCIALGLPFLTKRVKRGGVIYIAAEAAATIYERLEALRIDVVRPKFECPGDNELGSIDPNRLPIAVIDNVPDLAAEPGIATLELLCKEIASKMETQFGIPLRAIIVDTIGAAFALDNWNDASQARRLISALGRLRDATGATVFGVHHHGKNVERGATGSFVFTADPDFTLSVFRDADQTGEVKSRALSVTKNRRGRTGWTCGFALNAVSVGKDADREDVMSAYVVPQPEAIGKLRNKPGKPVGRSKNRGLMALEEALVEALINAGSERRVLGDGPPVRAVPRRSVREEFDRRYTVDSDDPKKAADARRKAFDRALQEGIAAGKMKEGHWDATDWLWRLSEGVLD